MTWPFPRAIASLRRGTLASRIRELRVWAEGLSIREAREVAPVTTLPAERVRELCRELEERKQALRLFAAGMEEEFLNLGGCLRQIALRSREVKERSEVVMEASAGRSEDAAIQFAFQLLKKAEDLVFASREKYARVLSVFSRMHVDLKRIARERNALMRTISPLETTNTQFRIQASVFNEDIRAQFWLLAETISGIVNDVRSAVQTRFEELEQTGRSTGELVARLSAVTEQEKEETELMLRVTRAHLTALGEMLQTSEAAALTLSSKGGRIGGGVGKAIVALQCQDIARQKLEHIQAAMDEMGAYLAPGGASGFHGEEETERARFTGGASRVQLQQLRSVFTQLDEAAQAASSGLADVGAEARSLSGFASGSAGATLDGEIIRQAIESIHDILGVIHNAVASIGSVLDLVRKLKVTFSGCTTQILELALRLRMVALNAQIFAAHVDDGAVLEEVASNTRKIADESMGQLDEISARIAELVDSVLDLEERLDEFRELATIEESILLTESNDAETRLVSLERDLRAALESLAALEAGLSETIQSATSGIRFPQVVAEARAQFSGFFESLAGEFSRADESASGKLQNLKLNYTMAEERELHRAATGETSFEMPDAPALDPEESLAGNVELF